MVGGLRVRPLLCLMLLLAAGCATGLAGGDDTTGNDSGTGSDTSSGGDVGSGDAGSGGGDSSKSTFTVGGNVSGLTGSVVLENNGADDLTVSADGPFTFKTALSSSDAFAVTVKTQPATQTCAVTSGTGNIANANVTNVAVACTDQTFAVGGTVSGLQKGQTLVLQDNGVDNLTLTDSGPFTFTTKVASGKPYAVTVYTQPAQGTCTLKNAGGTIATADITNVTVSCPGSVTYSYTGSQQDFTVPGGVTQVTLDVYGAQGNSNAQSVTGGLGGYATGTLTVAPSDVLHVFVGGGATKATTAGYNGGGSAATPPCGTAAGGGGGGASDVRAVGSALSDRVIVGAGGGGAAGNRMSGCGRGGGGGGGGGYYGGGGGAGWPYGSTTLPTGGTQTAGGTAGTSTYTTADNGTSGSSGTGGSGGTEESSSQAGSNTGAQGATGGGTTGTSGAYTDNFTGQSGAGGSSYTGGVTSGSTTAGSRTGAGQVKISW